MPILKQFQRCIEAQRMSQSFGGRGLDEIPLETIEKTGIKYNTYFIRKNAPLLPAQCVIK